MGKERKMGYERLEQTKKAVGGERYNRGIRAAAKMLHEVGQAQHYRCHGC